MQKLIVYGNGNIGKIFVEENSDKSIELILDQKVKKGTSETYKGIKVVNPEDYFIAKKRECIIVIAVYNWIPIADYLKNNGLQLGVDFIPYKQFNSKYIDYTLFCKAIDDGNDELIAGLINGKKIVMCYGMCHMIFYKDALSKLDSFNNKYVIVDIPFANAVCHIYYNKLYEKGLWEFCDVLICNPIEKSIYGDVISANKIISLVPDRTKVITVTSAQFIGFFPQVQSLNNNTISEKMAKEFSWGDKFINKMCKKGLPYAQIYQYIQKRNYLDSNKVIKYFNDAMDNMIAYERKCDVKIADYIHDNYKDKMLFYSPTHLTYDVMCELTRRILNQMKIEDYGPIVSEVMTDTHEVPIYPCVLHALGMDETIYEERMYNPGDYYNDKTKIDLETYVCRYCELYRLEMNN